MATCRSCGAVIHWRKTLRGKTIPINDDPDQNGNIILVNLPEGQRAQVLNTREDSGIVPGPRYTAHFTTCPEADEWRKP